MSDTLSKTGESRRSNHLKHQSDSKTRQPTY